MKLLQYLSDYSLIPEEEALSLLFARSYLALLISGIMHCPIKRLLIWMTLRVMASTFHLRG